MKVEKLKLSRDTMLTLKRMKINTISDLLLVSDNFLQDVDKFLCDVNECNKDSIIFDIGTLLELVKNNKVADIANLFDGNIKVDIAKGMDIVYPNNVCDCLTNFTSFALIVFGGDTSQAKKYVQDIIEGKADNGVLSAKEVTVMKSRFKDLYSYKAIGDTIGLTFQSIKIIVTEALKKLDRWIGSLGTDSIETLQLSTRANRCLNRIGVKTCSQLKMLKEDDLMLVRDMGTVTRNEVLNAINKLNEKNG